MKFSLDMEEMEQQRYNYIKKTNHYIEVDILIGTEEEHIDGHVGRMPVVTTMLHNCKHKDIACMYTTLKALLNQFMKEYPMECAMGELLMKSSSIGEISHEESEEERK